MSNLISYASTWNNDTTEQPKRRPSSMRRTYKKPPVQDNENEDDEEYHNPTSLDNVQNMNENKNKKVNELLNKMSTASEPLENNKMGQFTPISPPSVQVKKDTENQASSREYVPPPPSYLTASTAMKSGSSESTQYKANDKSAEIYRF